MKKQKTTKNRTLKIIIIIILLILILLLFIKLTGFIIRSVGTAINTCTDTDNEKEYWKQGEVFGTQTSINQAEDYHEKDECLNENKLKEFYCENYRKKSEEFNCPYGCSEGKCSGEQTETPQKTPLLQRIINWVLN